jgi:uncharacterized protein
LDFAPRLSFALLGGFALHCSAMSAYPLLSALLGGLLIGLAASLLLWGAGHAAGVSGIAGGLLRGSAGDWGWRAEFLGGLVAGGLLLRVLLPGSLQAPAANMVVLALAGVLVGLGAGLSGGCTSGHGICGLGRLSGRSLVAVLVFMFTGVVVVALVRMGGGS